MDTFRPITLADYEKQRPTYKTKAYVSPVCPMTGSVVICALLCLLFVAMIYCPAQIQSGVKAVATLFETKNTHETGAPKDTRDYKVELSSTGGYVYVPKGKR